MVQVFCIVYNTEKIKIYVARHYGPPFVIQSLEIFFFFNLLTLKQSRRGQCLDQRNNFQKMLFQENWYLQWVLVQSSWAFLTVLTSP